MFSLKLEQSFKAHSRSISSLKFSPNGQCLASSSSDCTVKVFRVGNYEKGVVYNLTNGHNRGISDVSWSPDGKYLASASDDTTIAIWSLPEDPISITEPCRKLTGHASYVYCVAFSPNGTILASGGFDDCLRLWDTRKGDVYKEIAAHGDPITSVDFSHDGTTLLTASFDGLMRLWDAESGRCLKTIVDNDNPPVSSASFTANSKYILTTTLDNHIRLWSPITAKCIRTFTAPGYTAQKYSCAARVLVDEPSQTILLLAASEDGAIYYWNLATRAFLGKHQVLEDKSPLLSMAISPDQKFIACAGLEPHNEIHILSIHPAISSLSLVSRVMALKRDDQFKTLENLLIKSAASFVFINGPTDCGKTTLLQKVVEEVQSIPVLCIDSLECITMTILYERLISFIKSKLRIIDPVSKAGGFKPCSTVTEMVTRLTSFNWPRDLRVILLLDEVERLFQLDSNSFSVLLRLPEMFDFKISLVMASREEFEDFGPQTTGGLVPIKISLKSFTSEEARRIICDQLKCESVSENVIDSTVKVVQQVANSTIKELSVLRNLTFSILETKRQQPSSSSSSSTSTSKLPKLIQERLDSSNRLDSFYKQTISSLNLIEKYLLISSFIASFQSSKDDLKVFGSSGNSRKKTKKLNSNCADATSTKNSDKLTLNLPKLFDQTRLLAIFYFLIEDYENPLPPPQQLQTTIKSLCHRGLLKFTGNSGTKIDSLKYRVNISKDFATNVADGLKIDLKNLIISS